MQIKHVTAAIMLFAGCMTHPLHAPAEEVYELSFQNMHAAGSTMQKAYQEWASEVEKRSGGRLVIHITAAAAITSQPGVYTGLRDGAVDIGCFVPVFNTAELPHAYTLGLPFLCDSGQDCVDFFYRKFYTQPEVREELNRDIKFLTITGSSHTGILSTKGHVRTPEELKGKRVLVWGPNLEAENVNSWGGNPVIVPISDTYIGLQRGMGDINVAQFANQRALKLGEIAKGVSLLYTALSPNFMGVNKAVWDSLPPDLQQILIDTTGEELARKTTAVVAADVDLGIREFREAGVPVEFLTPEQTAPFREQSMKGTTLPWYKSKLKGAPTMPDIDGWIAKVYALAAEPR